MVACVHIGLTPVGGTAIGASVGAVVNFTLARRWIFPARSHARIDAQAVRYAVVSLGSLALNTLGEHLAHDRGHMQYVLARGLVAGAVGLGWNFPLHRSWVFAPARTPSPPLRGRTVIRSDPGHRPRATLARDAALPREAALMR